MNGGTRTINLPSGKTAEVRAGKGRDLIRAHRAVAGSGEPMSISFALVAELARIDGKQLVYEDLLEMDLDDVLTLEAVVAGAGESQANFPAAETAPPRDAPAYPPLEQSSISSSSDSPSPSCERWK
jgi:hypothetical protein